MSDDTVELEPMEAAWNRMAVDYSEHTDLAPTDPHYMALAGFVEQSDLELSVLDLGSGQGYALDGILPRLPHARFTCMDISGEMLKELKQRLAFWKSRIELRKESYVDAEIGAECYDYVISAFTLHHLQESAKLTVFKKIYAALKEGGKYIELDGVASAAEEQASQQEFLKHVAHLKGSDKGGWNFDLCRSINNEKIILESAGFSVSVPWKDVDVKGSGRAIFLAAK